MEAIEGRFDDDDTENRVLSPSFYFLLQQNILFFWIELKDYFLIDKFRMVFIWPNKFDYKDIILKSLRDTTTFGCDDDDLAAFTIFRTIINE
jgi:hypothetical protein